MATWKGRKVLGTWLVLASLLSALAGCHGMQGRRSLVASEPPLLDPYGDPGSLVAEAPPTTQITFVDRHPLLSKPREYYQGSGDNPLVKATAATVIGIPAGVLGEMRQIVVGRPPEMRPY